MSSEWTPFTELLSTIVDNRGKTCPVGDSGIPLIATNCISNNSLYPSYDKARFVDKETYETWFRGHPIPGDILFVCKGSPGRTNWVPDPVDFCIAQDMVAVRADPEKVYPKYLFAALRSSVVLTQIDNMHVGTMIPHFKKGDFHKLNIPIPGRALQTFIGDYYFTISERITLLRETNSTLEAIAQALFKSWFVDFDPVHAKAEGRQPEGMEATTAALFPDNFEESELGLVPKGWGVVRLGDVTERITKGTTPTTLKRPFVESGINFVKVESITDDGQLLPEKFAYIDDETHSLLGRSQLKADDVLITIAGTIGRVAVITEDFIPANTNQAVAIVRPDTSKLPSAFVNQFLRLADSKSRMGERVVQAVQANLSLGSLSDMRLVMPPSELVTKLHDLVFDSIGSKRNSNQQCIRTLTQLRDTLLPRLISGQLRLPDAEQAVEEALA